MGPSLQSSSEMIRFGVFEFDLKSRELFKQGRRLRLSGQPAHMLEFLLRRPGELISREELQQALWPADTHVNFEQSLNAVVKRLRYALGDSPESPRFIETVARRGYRFIAPSTAPGQPIASSTAPASGIRSIAVLPFENATTDADAEYLIDGITESLINSLSRLPNLRVLARSTVFQYRGKIANRRNLGRKLNVDAMVVGRASRRGDELVIGTELVEVHHGWLIWGEQFSCPSSDVFSIETELSARISARLRTELVGKTDATPIRRQTHSPEAYQDYLKGRYHWNRMSAEALQKSMHYYQEALAKDPQFALAHAGLADCYGLMAFFDLMPPSVAMPKLKESALRALQIDANLAEAHSSVANALKFYDRDWLGAEHRYLQALQLNPNYVTAYRGYAALLAATRRFDESKVQIERAHEIDPMSVVVSMEMAWNFFIARQYDEAIKHALRTAELEPEFPSARYVLGLAYEQKGRFAEAEAALEQCLAKSHRHASGLASLGHLYGITGRRNEALQTLDRLRDVAAKTYVAPYWFAVVNAGLGDEDAVVDHLEMSFTQSDLWLVWLDTEPRFDAIRPNPRFQHLLRRASFAAQTAKA